MFIIKKLNYFNRFYLYVVKFEITVKSSLFGAYMSDMK